MILAAFPYLTSRDVRSTSSGANGADVILSAAGAVAFPYAVECKNRQDNKTLYKYYDQAGAHDKGLEPILVVKMNHRDPLVVISASHFFKLLDNAKSNAGGH